MVPCLVALEEDDDGRFQMARYDYDYGLDDN